jgi:hypothetical protein
MKRFIVALSLISASLLFAGVTFRGSDPTPPVLKKYAPSCGYTIIEYGKGIDCNGDTVKIVHKNGAHVRTVNS